MSGGERVVPDRGEGDRDEVWGDGEQAGDDRLTRERPPHWRAD